MRSFIVIALTGALVATACSRDEPDPVASSTVQSGETLESITDDEENIDLLLTPTTIEVKLSERLLEEVSAGFRSGSDEGESAQIVDTIRGALVGGVEKMLRHRMVIPLEDVRSMRFVDGIIEIEVEEGHAAAIGDIRVDEGRIELEDFAAADALRFIDTFERWR